ncbi:DUF2778 domain-containing protein [Paraburkholderia phenoliruptrix]|uniref:DUF2778 domain-containing protein n=1 Tax=Paraburkholderia phenoliruptrix TaxID=252970 RepID=UPI002869CBCD|nr:DUF2778 domain-containing protein [Paraburkholderia phenoliruptrix]WMY07449.1 DUF2778 domain-containing protein [Paraburkholderia phenoliruptrix]
MPVACTFSLNSRNTSVLSCPGVGQFSAFSGTSTGRDNPQAVAQADIGPLPPGRYYLVDRQSGGRLGWLYDFARTYAYGTDRSQCFMLWREGSGDTTVINGVRRGSFRLHPMGPRRLSEGCITVVNQAQFKMLADYLHKQGATLPIPGTTLKAYGYVDVK